MSCNELSFEGMSAEKTPVVVMVASSTGDGDSPDNAAKFYARIKCTAEIIQTSKSTRAGFYPRGLGVQRNAEELYVLDDVRQKHLVCERKAQGIALESDKLPWAAAQYTSWFRAKVWLPSGVGGGPCPRTGWPASSSR